MKAFVQWRPATTTYDIYLYQDGPKRVQLKLTGRDEWEYVDLGMEIAEPSFSLDGEVLKALAAAASETLPPDRAQAKHLEDAMAVRDRLLALVERG